MSQKERIFLDSCVIIGLFSGDDDSVKILEFLVAPTDVIDIATSLAREYKLLPNDALIAATCKYYGIEKIATFDSDFDKVDFLDVIAV